MSRAIPRQLSAALAGLTLAAAVSAGAPRSALAQQGCGHLEAFSLLDFWVGEWTVRVGGRQVGTNRIAKIMDGCAVTEEWTDVRGGEGRSLFYHVPWTGEWKQVWVTPTATSRGGLKEKRLVEELADGGVRFQGRIPDADGTLWYDRTTLTPLPDGRVRQHIEVSRDGVLWETTFDAMYERRSGGGAEGDGDGSTARAAPAADPADVASVDALMLAVYDVISGPAGQVRDEDRFRSLFMPGARLIPTGGTPESGYRFAVRTPEQFAASTFPVFERDGFWEREIHRVEQRHGPVVHVFSTYESLRTPDGEPFARGINSFQLFFDGSRWWVTTIYWHPETPSHPIPERYLPAGR